MHHLVSLGLWLLVEFHQWEAQAGDGKGKKCEIRVFILPNLFLSVAACWPSARGHNSCPPTLPCSYSTVSGFGNPLLTSPIQTQVWQNLPAGASTGTQYHPSFGFSWPCPHPFESSLIKCSSVIPSEHTIIYCQNSAQRTSYGGNPDLWSQVEVELNPGQPPHSCVASVKSKWASTVSINPITVYPMRSATISILSP